MRRGQRKADSNERWDTSRTRRTKSGLPLTLNRAPAPDLDPWVARIVIAKVEAPQDFSLSCGICNDIAFARVLLAGEWLAETADGPLALSGQAVLLGPHSKQMPVHCQGPFSSVNIGFRPGALRQLFGLSLRPLVDRIELSDRLGLLDSGGKTPFSLEASALEWAREAETRVRQMIKELDPLPPDPLSAAFELASFRDPNIAPGEFAEQQRVSLRQLERVVRRDFGLTPKTVLRRARALDLASQMLGLAEPREEAEFHLRYFDQSHLIREFQAFFGITPQAFRASKRMLLTLNLETRAARRLEALDRLAPGDVPPWEPR